jgi:hypothetical protein
MGTGTGEEEGGKEGMKEQNLPGLVNQLRHDFEIVVKIH